MKKELFLLGILSFGGCTSMVDYTSNLTYCEAHYTKQIAWDHFWNSLKTWAQAIVADPLKGITVGTAEFVGSFGHNELVTLGKMAYCVLAPGQRPQKGDTPKVHQEDSTKGGKAASAPSR